MKAKHDLRFDNEDGCSINMSNGIFDAVTIMWHSMYNFYPFSLSIYYLNAMSKGYKDMNLELKKKLQNVRM